MFAPRPLSAPYQSRRLWRVLLASGLAAVLGANLAVHNNAGTQPEAPAASTSAAPDPQTDRVLRDEKLLQHVVPPPAPPVPVAPKPEPAPAPKPEPQPEPKPEPVAGLTQKQMDNATAIVEVAQDRGMPEKAAVIGVATALQESQLKVLANSDVAESMNIPHEDVGSDHDSVGLFQQRLHWGPVDELMDPHASAEKFFEVLEDVPDWQEMPVTVAAQTVQVSAYPEAYADDEPRAREVVNEVLRP